VPYKYICHHCANVDGINNMYVALLIIVFGLNSVSFFFLEALFRHGGNGDTIDNIYVVLLIIFLSRTM